MQFLKQSTTASILVGPVLDSTGASYTSAVIADFNITKNGTSAAMAATATATHDHNGMYVIALTTGNTDTLGRVDISLNKATYAMSVFRYEVLTASTFDAIVTNAATAAGGLCDIQRMAGTVLTGRDIGTSVLLSSGTGTGQIKISSGYVAPDWGDVGNKTTTVALTGTTIATTQKVDIETIKTNPVVNGGTITFPSNATLASTTNITAAAGITLGNTAHGGSSATITLKSINVSNSTGDAVTLSSTGSDGHALYASANGGGDGFHIVAGATGHGFHLQGGSTSGDGIHATAQTSGDGIQATGAGAGLDINGTLSSVTTTTNLTNAPTVGDFTSTMKASIRTAVGLGSANLDTQLNAIYTVAGLVQAKTDNLPSDPADESLIIAATDAIATLINGLNDIAATDIVSGGAINTSGGIISSVLNTQQLNGHDVVHTAGKLWVLNENGDPISTGLSSFDVSSDTVLANIKQINDNTSAAAKLGAVYSAFESGTAQAGSTDTITLRSGASSSDEFYKDQAIFLLSGTGAGQTNHITAGYNGTSKEAPVLTPWVIVPDDTTIYFILGRIG